MEITINFKNRHYHFTKKAHKRYIAKILKDSISDLCESYKLYTTRNSESVYVCANLKDLEGYLLFVIKGHQPSLPTSMKVFHTYKFIGGKDLLHSIRKFVTESIQGKHALFKLNYGNYIGISSFYKLREKNLDLFMDKDSFTRNIKQSSIYLKDTNGVLTKVDDEPFTNRILTLIRSGLVRGYKNTDGWVSLYINELGSNIYKWNRRGLGDKYEYDWERNGIEGLIEKRF